MCCSCSGFTEDGPDSAKAMDHALAWILKYGGGIAFIIIIAWPCLALPAGVFSKGYFTFWVIISIIWGLVCPSWGRLMLPDRVCETA